MPDQRNRMLDERGFVILDDLDDENPTPADLNPKAVAECPRCDADGLFGGFRCDHVDYAAAAARGRRKIAEALAQTRIQTTQEPDHA